MSFQQGRNLRACVLLTSLMIKNPKRIENQIRGRLEGIFTGQIIIIVDVKAINISRD